MTSLDDDTAARLERARSALARAQAAACASPGSARREASGGQTSGARAPAGEPTAESGAEVGAEPTRGPAPEPEPDPDAEADPEAVARAIVLRQLTLAPRSRAQLEEKLRARACPEDVARRVLDRFTDVGLVDDRAYAHTLVRSRRETKGLARRALAHELRSKGVADDIVEESLSDIATGEEEDQARRLVDKRLRSLHGLDATVQTRRLAGMLARKGYSPAVAYRVVREALADSPQHRRD